jgi:LDH2 family malate/lactate/ureidoglycolate dehydrogenase
MICVSSNELTGLLKQAFEGMGFTVGDYEDAAEMVVAAQMYGLDALGELALALPQLAERENQGLALREEDASSAVIDARGSSSFHCASTALDLAYTKALEQTVATVTILNCRNPILVFKKLLSCCLRGVACSAHWRSAADFSEAHLLRVLPDGEAGTAPQCSYQRGAVPEDSLPTPPQSLRLSCSVSQQALIDCDTAAGAMPTALEYRLGPQAMAAGFEQALSNGIMIKEMLWAQLGQQAARVLVASSEQSRMGAGAS